ncbi:MAG: mechanosensitive ion channel, partial [Bacteroidota bacterium]
GDTIQSLIPKLRLPENLDLVNILKKIVFIFIFIPLLITALNILKMDAISAPATQMLEQFFAAVPKILVAVIILIFFIVGGRFISQLLTDLLESLKINKLLDGMNLKGLTSKTDIPKIIGNIAFFFIILFGLMTAIEKLEFSKLTEILNNISGIAGNILFGMIILVVGNWISVIAHNSLSKNKNNQFVASILRVCILAIFLSMGLKTMGIGNDIINMAFGITLGTVAITIALSFGLGGRAAAGKQMERIINKFNNED